MYRDRLISIDKAERGMVIAKNISSESGHVLVSKGTRLTDPILSRLKLRDIKSIYIYELNTSKAVESSKNISVHNLSNSFTEKAPAFYEFEEAYEKKVELIKNEFYNIANEAMIDLFDMYTVSKEILDVLNTKGDMFLYLDHLKNKDDYTFSHCLSVSLICNVFSRWLNMRPEDIVNITAAGMLHDIGKIKIDDKILKKPGKLTKEEYDEIKNHTIYGYRMLQDYDIPNNVKLAALMHHEKIDGSGYPVGVSDRKIAPYAKIVCITDLYEAMTAERVYRTKICPFDVIRMFEQEQFGCLDTKYLLVFLENIAYNYIGFNVILTNNDEAEIVFINKLNLSKPIVKTLNGKFIDLSKEDVSIKNLS